MSTRKKVILVHGWEGSPQNCWFPWLKSELGKEGFSVDTPAMPNPEAPIIEDWVGFLSDTVGRPDRNTYLIGHSIGCQAVLRYVEQLKKPIGGIICVAGFFTLTNLETDEEKELARPWLEMPMNYEKIRRNAGPIVAIFSDDDPWIDLSNKDFFEQRLGARTIIEHQKGHFDDDTGITILPSILDAIIKISGERQESSRFNK